MFDYQSNVLNMQVFYNRTPEQSYGGRTDIHAFINSTVVIGIKDDVKLQNFDFDNSKLYMRERDHMDVFGNT